MAKLWVWFSGTAMLVLLAVLLIGGSVFVWTFCRVEPRNGEIAIMIRKTGRELPPGQILALSPEYKGVQLNVLGEGRYFRNPYTWTWEIRKVTDIPAGKFGVLVRKFGSDLPEGQIIAVGPESKGIVAEVLGTGRHRINPYAYYVQIYDDIRIMPGNIGVITSLTGADILSGTPNDTAKQNGFLVDPSRKGILEQILKEGTHRINPFVRSVSIVNIQSQRYEFSGADAIGFITLDGFHISLEGTVEFNILSDYAPRLTHEVGDMEDILKKLILPSVSGFARIEGSKKSATEFIVGESRQIFQNKLEDFLRKNCKPWGISINSVLVRDIIPPDEIARIIRNRELAQQVAKKFKQQIEQAKSEMELRQQEMLALRKKLTVQAETDKITSEIAAKQAQLERLIAAKSELEAAAIDFQTAQANMQSVILHAEAERKVIAARYQSEIEVLRQSVKAYGSGDDYVRGLLFSKLAPRVSSIMSNGSPNGIFGLPFAPANLKEVK